MDVVLLSGLIRIVAISSKVEETSFRKKQFQLKPSFVRAEGEE